MKFNYEVLTIKLAGLNRKLTGYKKNEKQRLSKTYFSFEVILFFESNCSISCPLVAFWKVCSCAQFSHSGSGSLQVLQNFVASFNTFPWRQGSQ